MATEGIMALPQGMGMQGEQAQQQQSVTSADSYDAAQTALGMVNPEGQAALKEAIRQNIGDVQLTPQQLSILIQVFEYVSQNPGDYKNLLQKMIEAGALEKGDMPEEYDPEFIGAMLAVLLEMQQMQGAGAQEPMDMSPVVEGLQPMGMASGGLADVGQYLASKGRGGDSILAHITPEEAAMLKRRGGSGTINPATGLPEFKGGVIGGALDAIGGAVKGVVNIAKDVIKSPVGRIMATVALATVLGPAAAGFGMSLSAGAAAGLAGAGVSLLGGGSIKDALISGAMGYIGGGGDFGGLGSPLKGLSSYLPGAAGSALNTGLTTGVIGAGIGKLGGMSTQDALQMGLMSGATSAALQGLSGKSSVSDAQLRDPAFTGDSGTGAVDAPGPISDPGPTGPTGPTGTAQDLLARGGPQSGGTGLKMPPMGSSTRFDPNYSLYDAPAPGPAPGMGSVPGMADASGSGIRLGATPAGASGPDLYAMQGTPMTGVRGMDGATGAGLRGSAAVTSADLARGIGGTASDTNYSLTAAKPSIPQPASFTDKMVSGAKDLYNEYLSPSRPGLPADAGFLRKYGPLALAGTAAIAATGGTKEEPAEKNPAFDRNYTGMDYMRDNPDMFRGGLSTYTRPTTPDSPVVPTPSYSTIPVGQPGMVTPGGVTRSPGGVAQPYNVSGLYGVPLIYGPDGQLRRMAKGGDAKMTQFPRKNGPINGPGTGTSDDIPAMLSDGEFVFTAKAVRNAGGGSRRKGAARMYKLMKKLEGGAVKGK
jgi:hypothetical protein